MRHNTVLLFGIKSRGGKDSGLRDTSSAIVLSVLCNIRAKSAILIVLTAAFII